MIYKILWVDTETTGLDHRENAMVRLGGLVDVGGFVVDEFDLKFAPFCGAVIEPAALAVNGLKVDEIQGYPPAAESLAAFGATIGQHIDLADPQDRFVLAGFSVAFDWGFIRSTWRRSLPDDSQGLKAFVFGCPLDVQFLLARQILDGLRLDSYSLVCACRHFGVALETAHDALSDIRATRALYRRLLHHRPRFRPPAPRYDDVFFEGLDLLAQC